MSLNEQWLDANIRHQIFLLKRSKIEEQEIIDELNQSEERISSIIRERLSDDRNSNLKKLAALLVLLLGIRKESWKRVRERWASTFSQLESNERNWLFETASGLTDNGAFAKGRVSGLSKEIFQGRTIADWLKDMEQSDTDRIATAIKAGTAEGQTGYQIARRISGTKALKGSNGTTQMTRNAVAGVVRTLYVGVSAFAMKSFAEINDFLTTDIWISVLDSRTTPVCRALSGKRFKIGKGPYPPIHFKCRSRRMALLDGSALAEPTYEEWLRRQPVDFQDMILGKTRGVLFRRGGLSLDNFVDFTTREQFTLDELARLEKQAFIDAGVKR